jgi:glycoprotein endo-alpha-1,2-mannosidase
MMMSCRDLAHLLLSLVALLPAHTSVAFANIFVHEDAPNPPDNVIVGAYYYPWHKAHFQISREGYIRRFLEPRQEIRLGEYDDTQPEVITQHLEWSKQANIDVWVTSWWGPNSREDTTIREVILPHPGMALTNHKIALLYETTGRIKKSEGWDTFRLAGDMDYICNTRDYMNHPNYFTIQGRPVLVVYLTRRMEIEGKLPEIIDTIRNACPGVYIIGDQVWGDAPNEALDDLDAITNYDMYGNMGKPRFAGQAGVNEYYSKAADWKIHANEHNAAYVPGVSPG